MCLSTNDLEGIVVPQKAKWHYITHSRLPRRSNINGLAQFTVEVGPDHDGKDERHRSAGLAPRGPGPHRRSAAEPPPRTPALGVERNPGAGESRLITPTGSS